MADNFENLDGLIPEWANEDIGTSLAEALDQYENEKTAEKSRFAEIENKELHKIPENSQSIATKRNTKGVVKLFEGKLKMFHIFPFFLLKNRQIKNAESNDN